MRKFMKQLGERPIVQTLFFLALESVAIIMTNVVYCLENDRMAELYGYVLFIVTTGIYLFLFLGCLVLFATAFLRNGWARKLLWLCSFAITACSRGLPCSFLSQGHGCELTIVKMRQSAHAHTTDAPCPLQCPHRG